jgi:hypothetical protein
MTARPGPSRSTRLPGILEAERSRDEVGPSVVEDRQVELTQARWVAERVDFDDLWVPDR